MKVIKAKDLGIIPLLLSMPFMYFPKLLGGDTQPWVLMTALLALFTFRTDNFIKRKDVILVMLALSCVTAYAFRSEYGFGLLRNAYTYITFLIFWMVCQRENGEYFHLAVKFTIFIWFIVGLYQFMAVKLGYSIEFTGRYVEGRSGIPSLTAEASYYGSLSMLQLMYLLNVDNNRVNKGNNKIFIIFALASVVMSGSLLAMILLIFPLRKLPLPLKVVVLTILPLLVIWDYYYSSSGLASRIMDIVSGGVNFKTALHDASLNLRTGHIYFTLFVNLLPSLLLITPIDFMAQYNNYAVSTGILIATGSNFILPAIGEMIYGSGIFAVLLLLFLFKRSAENCTTVEAKVERIAFATACMLNPITISNIFLIMYLAKKE